MEQAIIIKVLGATNTKGTRIKASTKYSSVTMSFDYSAGNEQRIIKAVDELMNKLGRSGEYIIGYLPNGDYVAVFKD